MPRFGSPSRLKTGAGRAPAAPLPISSSPTSSPSGGGGGDSSAPGSSVSASGGGGADSSVRWPSASRRITIATHLPVADTAYPFGVSGNPKAWVAICDQAFAGDLEVSSDGNTDWYPLSPASVWPISLRGRKSRVVWLRRRSAGAGVLVIAAYATSKEAERCAKFIGGQSPSSSSLGTVTTASPTRDLVSRDPIATGGAVNGVELTINAATEEVHIFNRGDGELFIAETAAKATTAKGLLVPPGQGRTFKYSGASGSLYYASDATGCTFDVQETTEA